jgi:hypothetical protein
MVIKILKVKLERKSVLKWNFEKKTKNKFVHKKRNENHCFYIFYKKTNNHHR